MIKILPRSLLTSTLCLLAFIVNAENHHLLQETTNNYHNLETLHQETYPENELVWISVDADAVENIKARFSPLLAKNTLVIKKSSLHGVGLMRLPASYLHKLSEFMHAEYNRCGGFIFHSSLTEAKEYLASSNKATPKAVTYTIDNAAAVQSLTSLLQQNNLTETVDTLSDFHTRYYQHQSGVAAAEWIRTHWQTLGASRSDINVELYAHEWAQPSVIATITGIEKPDEIVVIGGHLDSINLWAPNFARAPGADDNASGIAVITETLRTIVASGYKPKRTIKLMGYAAEEVGLRGSNAIATEFKANGLNVLGMVQFDMTGYHGSNADIVFMTDYTNAAQNQFMVELLDTYHQDILYDFGECGYACSDHASWHNQGYAASMPFESHSDEYNPNIHTAGDNTFDSSHSIKFARLAVTYIAELAKGSTGGTPPTPTPSPTPTLTPSPIPSASPSPSPTVPPNSQLENGVAVFNLSAAKNEDLLFTLPVPNNAINLKIVTSGGSGDSDLYVKRNSVPTDTVYDCRPYESGNNETCEFTSPSAGTYHVRLKAYQAFTGLTLIASYEIDDNSGEVTPIDEVYTDIDVNWLRWAHFSQTLTEGYSQLSINVSGGTGNVSLYVRQDSQPTFFVYDCRSNNNSNEESCVISNPQAGTWHIGIFGNSRSNGVNLSIEAN